MPTEITQVIGATEEEVKQKKFNIFIGISLGNKWFNKKNIREYILWALKDTGAEKLPIVIGDTLHAINYEVRDGYNPDRAIERALRVGNRVEAMIREIIPTLPEKERTRIEILRWNDAINTNNYDLMKKLFYEEFEKKLKFNEFILEMVRKSTMKSEKEYSEEEIKKLAQYVLDELPLFLRGMKWKDIFYNLHPYPLFTMINELVRGMRQGKLFPEIYSKIDRHKIAIVELKII